MKVTIQEILEKLDSIDDAVVIVKNKMSDYGREFPGQEPLWKVIDLLDDYKLMILSTEVDLYFKV